MFTVQDTQQTLVKANTETSDPPPATNSNSGEVKEVDVKGDGAIKVCVLAGFCI